MNEICFDFGRLGLVQFGGEFTEHMFVPKCFDFGRWGLVQFEGEFTEHMFVPELMYNILSFFFFKLNCMLM